jgi:GNAT superfamily N-acetyltransferase
MIRVERATAELVALLDRSFPEPERPWSRHLNRLHEQELGRALYFVAILADEPVGWVLASWPGREGASAFATESRLVEVEDLFVAEQARRRGAGRALLSVAEDAARAGGWAGVTLAVTVANPSNDAARALYASSGYVDSGVAPYDDGYFYWTPDGEQHWDGEPHRRLVKHFAS